MCNYIKRYDAYQAVADNNYSDDITLKRYDAILKSIGEIPAADVRENVHEHWINASDTAGHEWWRCSNPKCGAYIEKTFFANDYEVNFCPQCGSIMDGGR